MGHEAVVAAIRALAPGAEFSMAGKTPEEALDSVVFYDLKGNPEPTRMQILAKIAEIGDPMAPQFPEKLIWEIRKIQDKTQRKAAIRIATGLIDMYRLGGADYVTEEVAASSLPQAIKDKIVTLL